MQKVIQIQKVLKDTLTNVQQYLMRIQEQL